MVLGAHPASYTMCTEFFPGVMSPERGVDHQLSSIAEVKEIVELYRYSPYEPSWPALGWPLPLLYISQMSSMQRVSYNFHSITLVCPGFHTYVITALIPVVRRAHTHTHLLATFRTPCITTYFLVYITKKCRKGRVYFFVAFFSNLWASVWKLGTYHIRARRWSVKAVCGDAVCINHVCICRQAGRQAGRQSFIIRLLEPLRGQLALALPQYCHYTRKLRLIGDVYTAQFKYGHTVAFYMSFL